eukprot:scaffold3825_cov179-Ochromonas_danica.AAC.6
MFKALKFNLPWKRNKKIKKIILGICAMDKKARSKPMREIIERLPDEIFEIVYFGDECILNEPIESWPVVDVLIAFYSTRFPTDKALQYVKYRKPFLINDLTMEEVLKDRRKVYNLLESIGIDVPFHVYVNRDEPLPEGSEDPNVIEEFDEYIVINGVQINKPLVEKPVDAEDHNIYIYYPMHAGGGSKRLFRKVDDRSSEFYPHINEIRRQGSYIYEEFVLTHGTDVKVYTVGPDYGHAEARKSPVVDGRVKRDSNGREVRFPVILSQQEKEMARKIVRAFRQTVCGFDILRVQGRSFCCDVNGFSFVKNSRKYYDDASQILTEIMINAVRPEYKSPYSTQVPLLRTIPVAANANTSNNLLSSNSPMMPNKPSSSTRSVRRDSSDNALGSSTHGTTNGGGAVLADGSGKFTNSAYADLVSNYPDPVIEGSLPSTATTPIQPPTSQYFNQSQSRYEQEELRGVIAIIRHGDRTPKQKIKIVVTESRFLDYFHSYVKTPIKELKVKSKSGLLRFLEVTREVIQDKQTAPELRRKLFQIRDVLERWEISGINRKLQMKPLKWEEDDEEDEGEEEGEGGVGGGSGGEEAREGEEEPVTPILPLKPSDSSADLALPDLAASAKYMPSNAAIFTEEERKLPEAPYPIPHQNSYTKVEGLATSAGGKTGKASSSSSATTAGGELGVIKEKKYGLATEILIILKWGGDLTPLGREQAEHLGAQFRTEHYPESDNGGVLRLHATYRHDLKIKASDEGRVIKTAAAFTKGLLALEGQLTPIISSLVTMEEKNRQMLDRGGNFEMKEEMDRCKSHLNLLQVDQNIDDELIDLVAPQCSQAMRKAFVDLGNPLQALKRMHYLIGRLTTQLEMICAQQYAYYEAQEAQMLELQQQQQQQLLLQQAGETGGSSNSGGEGVIVGGPVSGVMVGGGIVGLGARSRTVSGCSASGLPGIMTSLHCNTSIGTGLTTVGSSGPGVGDMSYSGSNTPRPVVPAALDGPTLQYIELGSAEATSCQNSPVYPSHHTYSQTSNSAGGNGNGNGGGNLSISSSASNMMNMVVAPGTMVDTVFSTPAAPPPTPLLPLNSSMSENGDAVNHLHSIDIHSTTENILQSFVPIDLYLSETCDLMWDRWDKLYRDFYSNKLHKYDLTKVPDVFDMIRYDLLHNSALQLSGMEELYQIASKFERCVVPQEYGTDKEDKRYIGSKMCGALLEKIKHDLTIASTNNSLSSDPMLYQLDQSHAEDLRINSFTRCVRTRLYFTSESHLHTVLNILRYPKPDSKFALSKEAEEVLENITDVSYLSQIIIRLFQDRNDGNNYSCEIAFSSGTSTDVLHDRHNSIAPYVIIEKSASLDLVMGLLDESIDLYRSTKEERGSALTQTGSENGLDAVTQEGSGIEAAEEQMQMEEQQAHLLHGGSLDHPLGAHHDDGSSSGCGSAPLTRESSENHALSPVAGSATDPHVLSPSTVGGGGGGVVGSMTSLNHPHLTHHHSLSPHSSSAGLHHSVPASYHHHHHGPGHVRRSGSITVNMDELNSLTSDRWENSLPVRGGNTKTFIASRSFSLGPAALAGAAAAVGGGGGAGWGLPGHVRVPRPLALRPAYMNILEEEEGWGGAGKNTPGKEGAGGGGGSNYQSAFRARRGYNPNPQMKAFAEAFLRKGSPSTGGGGSTPSTPHLSQSGSGGGGGGASSLPPVPNLSLPSQSVPQVPANAIHTPPSQTVDALLMPPPQAPASLSISSSSTASTVGTTSSLPSPSHRRAAGRVGRDFRGSRSPSVERDRSSFGNHEGNGDFGIAMVSSPTPSGTTAGPAVPTPIRPTTPSLVSVMEAAPPPPPSSMTAIRQVTVREVDADSNTSNVIFNTTHTVSHTPPLLNLHADNVNTGLSSGSKEIPPSPAHPSIVVHHSSAEGEDVHTAPPPPPPPPLSSTLPPLPPPRSPANSRSAITTKKFEHLLDSREASLHNAIQQVQTSPEPKQHKAPEQAAAVVAPVAIPEETPSPTRSHPVTTTNEAIVEAVPTAVDTPAVVSEASHSL